MDWEEVLSCLGKIWQKREPVEDFPELEAVNSVWSESDEAICGWEEGQVEQVLTEELEVAGKCSGLEAEGVKWLGGWQ